MDIEELAFKDRKTLEQLNKKDLLDIIEFLQSDRKLWINQFSKTHNESIDVQEENQELKKQLEEWKHHLKCSKEMLNIQGQKGSYDYDEYMLGLYNGMEYIISLFETREPNYISGKDVEFTNNKTQQKEFINYLEDGIKSSSALDTINKQTAMYIYSTTLKKYKEITGIE